MCVNGDKFLILFIYYVFKKTQPKHTNLKIPSTLKSSHTMMLRLKVMATQKLRNKMAEDNVQVFCPQVCSKPIV